MSSIQSGVRDTASSQQLTSVWPDGRFYRPELDALRFGAFLFVYESHTLPSPKSAPLLVAIRSSGMLGVQLFFVLSAYLITELLMREKSRTSTVDMKAFYLRRILRIWPLYFAGLFACFALSRILHADPMPISAPFAYLFLFGNMWSVWHGFLPLGLGALWTICLEEQFYLVWPTVVRVSSRRVMQVLTVALFLLAQVCFFALLQSSARQPERAGNIWVDSITHFQYFVLGAGLCFAFRGKVPNFSPVLRAVMIFAGLFLLFQANYKFHIADTTTNITSLYFGYLITGFGVCLLLAGVLGVTSSPRWGPIIWLGKISYGLYIFHLPVLELLAEIAHNVLHLAHSTPFAAIFGIPVTVPVAYLSYRYFETPFLRIKERFTIVKSRTV